MLKHNLLFFPVCQFSCLFNTEKMTALSFSISIGFAMCPFMPASNALFLSSTKAFAVMAMIGIVLASSI